MIKRIAVLMALGLAFTACSDRSNRDQRNAPAPVPSTQPGTPERDGATPPPPPGPQSSIRGEGAQAKATDQEVTRTIRQAISSDESLSRDAQSIQVSAAEGVVTLRGAVKDAQEKSRIEAIAKQTSGVQRVESELEVAS